MLADIQKFLAEQDFSSSDWQIFYAGLLVAALLWLGKSIVKIIYQRLTRKQPIFEGDTYDLKFPSTDNGAIVGRETELADLAQAWRSPDIRVLALVAWAGVGKTALVNVWREAIKFSEKETLSPKRIYAWSFQNQGIANTQTSSGAFFDHALRWFKSDIDEFKSEHDKGVYLAKLINTQRTLLILDGLEVFQPYTTAELQGQLNDQALLGLLQTLAKDNAGLCLLTTRQALGEHLTRYQGVRNRPLENLSTTAAVQLLQRAGVKGKAQELETVATEYHGHAYSLTLLANYLRQYAKGDIRRRDTLPALTDEARAEGWQAQQLLWAYADALEGREDLGLLYVTSVFDQAVEHGLILELIRALKKGGYQTALNKLNLTRLDELQRWAACCGRLRKQDLLLGNSDEWLDVHPLVRDFFRREFAQRHGGIKKRIHLELYEYYKALPEKELPDTLLDMQPLFSAVAHGCAAGLHQQVLDEVYWPRIRRKNENYICAKLGVFSDDLATVAHFFSSLWHTPAAGLTEQFQASVLGWVGQDLFALGRLTDAVEPFLAAVELFAMQKDWINSSVDSYQLGMLQLTLGEIMLALSSAKRSVKYADQSKDMFQVISGRIVLSDILHQMGDLDAAFAVFREAEQLLQQHNQYSSNLLGGHVYCDLLLTRGQTQEAVWWGERMLRGIGGEDELLKMPMDKLTLGRAHFQQGDFPQAAHWLDQAVAGLRAAGQQDHLPRGLLARAALHRHTHDFDNARKDLQEVFDIADGSGMRLHLTDYHLEMARLLVAEGKTLTPTPLPLSGRGANTGESASSSPSTAQRERGLGGEGLQAHIEAAAKLIEETGYHRRDKELLELQQAITKG
ncbi:tetratricopeptide repeat protein [Thiothrix sp.]|jgi:tetratricopeptide (TPR) repeat protein|uniref:tetratricopeptide repeat protein n=1 Tax=Thiothrix sp. TaxID=1032 RepID=UPI00257F10CA|nr:tetratricopeptide repeat protein [Thiothrix sp.]